MLLMNQYVRNLIVFINLNVPLSNHKLSLIQKFLEKGGNILCLGDHTDMEGLMKCYNRLLSPVGIKFNFDIVEPLDDYKNQYWQKCIKIVPHFTTRGITGWNEILIWGGASLEIRKDAKPLIIGRYAHSDIGDYSNTGRGAYLGNRRYDRGERVGDLCLVARGCYGKGKILVFGDTSPFQNTAFPYTYRFILNCIKWLCEYETIRVMYILSSTIKYLSVILFLVLIIYFIRDKDKFKYTVFPTIGLFAGMLAGYIRHRSAKINYPVIDALVDYSHNENFNIKPLTSKSIEGLMVNLMRNGFLFGILYNFDEKMIDSAKLLVLIFPQRSFNKKEIKKVKRFINNGGILLVSAGWESKKYIEPFLKMAGVDILNLPLGFVKSSFEEKLEPRFFMPFP